jgi:hypothetical protein
MKVDQLRGQLEVARENLRSAIGTMAERWDKPCLPSEAPQVDEGASDDTWTPQQASQHAILGQMFHALILARALYRFDTPEQALAALDSIAAAVDLVAADVTDGDLDRFASGIGEGQQRYLRQLGLDPNRDLEAVLRLSAGHLEDHARQLEKAAHGL